MNYHLHLVPNFIFDALLYESSSLLKSCLIHTIFYYLLHVLVDDFLNFVSDHLMRIEINLIFDNFFHNCDMFTLDLLFNRLFEVSFNGLV